MERDKAPPEFTMHQKWGSYSKSAAARLKAKDLNRHMRLYNDPVTNLKTLLYGPQSPILDTEPEIQTESQNRFIAHLDKTLEDLNAQETESNTYAQENLLRKQDAYIEQLENENTTLKVELSGIRNKVEEVLCENQGLIQYQKSKMFQSLIRESPNRPSTVSLGTKGLSDEEKMNQERAAQTSDKPIIRDDDQMRELIKLRKDNDEMVVIISQLEAVVKTMRIREDEAQRQINESTRLVEEAQYERVRALVARDKLKEENEKQQMHIERLVREHAEKVDIEHNTLLKLQKNKCDAMERELIETSNNLLAIRSSLEKGNREKLDLQHQLQKAEHRLDTSQRDMQQMAEKLQEEITKALTERNVALQDLTQIKLNWDRAKHDHQKELLWLKSELSENRKRMEQAEDRNIMMKSELVRLKEKNLFLEGKIECTEQWAKEEVRGRTIEVDQILNRAKTNEEEWTKSFSTLHHKNDQRHAELERMIELQISLVKNFKDECLHLAKQVESITQQYQNSTDHLKRENGQLMENLTYSGKKCKDLEKLCDEHNRRQLEMKQKLQQMEKEIEAQNKNVVELLSRQNFLLKERQMLHD